MRTALDKGMLKLNEAAYIAPRVVMLLARDVAAAMLHLHRWAAGVSCHTFCFIEGWLRWILVPRTVEQQHVYMTILAFFLAFCVQL